jgi:FkbM family methyltransferase
MTALTLNQFIYDIKQDQHKPMRDNGLLPFIGHCIANVDKSASQNYQDIWALYENKFKRDGYFVEFGATDGVGLSNTVLLEREYGWKGILAEPNPVWHDQLFENRSCHITKKCVYSKSGVMVDFLKTLAPDLATVKGFGNDDEHRDARKNAETIQVETISLVDMLNEYSAPEIIDYMSVDTEGTEYGIINSFFMQNQNKYKVRTMTIEHNFTPMRERVLDLMSTNGYERVFTDVSRWDDFYVNRSI